MVCSNPLLGHCDAFLHKSLGPCMLWLFPFIRLCTYLSKHVCSSSRDLESAFITRCCSIRSLWRQVTSDSSAVLQFLDSIAVFTDWQQDFRLTQSINIPSAILQFLDSIAAFRVWQQDFPLSRSNNIPSTSLRFLDSIPSLRSAEYGQAMCQRECFERNAAACSHGRFHAVSRIIWLPGM